MAKLHCVQLIDRKDFFMSHSLITTCWTIIGQHDQKSLTTDFDPLYHIDQYLQYFDLAPLSLPEHHSKNVLSINSLEPGFKNVSNDILYSLRHHIYTQTKLEKVEKWAEKLMRFCEIRYASLKKRTIKKCRTSSAAQLLILHLSSFLMDQSRSIDDLRYLNTVLKLLDLRWILNKKRLISNLSNSKELSSALFQFRIVLMTECILNQIDN
jgi:hypothetical protein